MVKTRDTTSEEKSRRSPSTSLHNLERQQKYLLTLSRQLNSYHCVPKTIALHEQLENIRRGIRTHFRENEKLIHSIGNPQRVAARHLADCEAQYQKMLHLEREVLAYIGKARIHS